MTLIIAANVQDHLILAADHCAVLSQVSNQGPPDLVLNNYQKVYPWKYGAIAASGDVFLMVAFCRLFMQHESMGGPIDLLQIAKAAKNERTGSGAPLDQSTGNLFFTLPGRDGFDLHMLSVDTDRIYYESIEPIGIRFSSVKGGLDDAACQTFTDSLRPSFFFEDIGGFYQHHLDLLGASFDEQSAISELVTSSFDVFMLDRRTGVGEFWMWAETHVTGAGAGKQEQSAVGRADPRRREAASRPADRVSLLEPCFDIPLIASPARAAARRITSGNV